MACGCGKSKHRDPVTLCDCPAGGGPCTTYVMTFDKTGNATLTLEDLVTPYTPTGATQTGGDCP